ncbi:MAG: hypothetical protein AAFP20_22420 [Cyanobacteria bacterium J06614_10]
MTMLSSPLFGFTQIAGSSESPSSTGSGLERSDSMASWSISGAVQSPSIGVTVMKPERN